MTDSTPRLRMFAGPNGSGKTTVKNGLQRSGEWFGVYINPDDLESTIRTSCRLPLEPFGIEATTDDLQSYFAKSEFLRSQGLVSAPMPFVVDANVITFGDFAFTSYHASVLADFLRRKLMAASQSLSFETVMSSADKVELLRLAQSLGYRTYLYYIATEDPAINVQRVKNRVADGGHDVPEKKIVSRYHRSLQLVNAALRHTNRGFFFDTSEEDAWYFAEATDAQVLHLIDNEMPNWFQPIWEQF